MLFIELKKQNLYFTLKKNCVKCVAYNAMGKTLLLKTLTNNWQFEMNNKQTQYISASQNKKINFLIKNKKTWILDEPYSDLDFYNYIYMKTILKEHINKNGIIIYTLNKMKNKNKNFYFYFSSYWI